MGEENLLFWKHSKEFEQRQRTTHLGKIKCITELGTGEREPEEMRNKSRARP